MTVIVTVLAVVLLMIVVVGFHELGHFTFGKIFGIRVDQFSIGFGKKLVSRQWGETEYAIRAIPLGGFVRMAGMVNLPSEADAGERNFYRASIPKRMMTLSAGVLFNIILSGLLYTVFFMLPNPSTVASAGPAALAGLHAGDSLISIGGMPIDHSSGGVVSADVHQALDATDGHPTTVVYRSSDGTTHTTKVTPQLGIRNTVIRPDRCGGPDLPVGDSLITAVDGHPVLFGSAVTIVGSAHVVSGVAQTSPCDGQRFTGRGIPSGVGPVDEPNVPIPVNWRLGMGLDYRGLPFGQAVVSGWGQVPQFFSDEYTGIKQLFSDPNTGGPLGQNGFQGPIGIGAQTVTAAQSGLQSYLFWMALISMNLALINILPIPFLDGGKVLIVALEAVRRRRLDPRREMAIYAAGAALLLVVFLYVTIGDIRRLFHGS